eukprot:4334633-Pyramimonas_sp.AAC.2
MKHGYILKTDQSGTGSTGRGQIGLDTHTVEWTVKTFLSRLVTRTFNPPANSIWPPSEPEERAR